MKKKSILGEIKSIFHNFLELYSVKYKVIIGDISYKEN